MRKRRPVYFIFCEGKSNKTETTYLMHFKKISSSYSMVIKPTDHTEPLSMLSYAVSYCRNHGFDVRSHDLIFLLLDVDTKENVVDEERYHRKGQKKNVSVLFSNSSFEVWFLDHYIYTEKSYRNQDELIADLNRYLPEYEKNKDVFSILGSYEKALRNARRQSRGESCLFQESAGTDFYKLLEVLVNPKE